MTASLAPILAVGDLNVAKNVGFGIIAVMMVVAAVNVVRTSNVVHAALWLVLVLSGVAAQYILAAAEFVAVSQVLVYVGAVMVLFLFGIMLTRAQLGGERDVNNSTWPLGIPVALVLLGVLTWVVLDGVDELPGVEDSVIIEPAGPAPTAGISDGFIGPYLVPFIALSFVLLAAAIGAIVLARKD
jgi:NADH-quinone oxidoreductase subunit J